MSYGQNALSAATEIADALEARMLATDQEAGRVPADASRGLFAHERTARVDFAAMDDDQQQTGGRIARILHAARGLLLAGIEALLFGLAVESAEASAEAAATTAVDTLIMSLVARNQSPRALGHPEVTGPLRTSSDTIAGELEGTYGRALERVTTEAVAQRSAAGRVLAVSPAERVALARAADALVRLHVLDPILHEFDRLLSISPARRADGSMRPAREVARNVIDSASSLSAGPLEAAGNAAAAGADAAGRASAASRLPAPARIYASELLDRNRCRACSHVDGREYASLEAARRDYPSGRFKDCEGGERCRGTLIFVWPTEVEPTLQRPSRKRR